MKKTLIIMTVLAAFAVQAQEHYYWMSKRQGGDGVYWSSVPGNTNNWYHANPNAIATNFPGTNAHVIIDKKKGDERLWVDYDEIQNCLNCPIYIFNRNYLSVSFQGKMPVVSFIYSNSPAITYLLADTLLEDIYVIDDIPTEDTSRHQIKAIYYSDIYGIIRYDMYDDRVYELQIE
jgi:hypothetical protein